MNFLGLISALAVQRWPPKPKNKKFAQNFLKFCRAVLNTILSIPGKNRSKIL